MLKDKLTKHNHKRGYFVFRKAMIIAGISLLCSCAIVIPVWLAIDSAQSSQVITTSAE